ncbi:pyruvate dehydrogenase E1 component alpha subunit [Haloechinothrix alba]|uniref:Pyruvate dehydrogenase E1 component alpha subunit n=1 Tax=Haloechinothrix alba TaxID=664784 RepID=A0A239A5D6_9PSEU|nr:thiamine pyrophosphate-dependent dehydrogenase E1 component subunit alpha [Haloechinothrix alba]SNR90845.1 pyruvate dehydrogenase E1 component alpha subunit [Haloechinothrix alba]
MVHAQSALEADAAETALSTADLTQMYRTMRLITSTGEHAVGEVKAGRLKSAFYPVRGLEGACAAMGVAMLTEDQLVSNYRSLGDALAKGASLRSIVAEIYGRADGTSKGKGGAMHIHDQSVGFVTSTGVVGSGIPIAAGLGLAAQLDGAARAVVSVFGDGTTSIGAYHESMNLASLWNLPMVFVCQNNQWAEHTPIAEYAASTDLAARAEAYAMPSLAVDGFDPIATAQQLRTALGRARNGGGPTFVEIKTYRLTGHSGSSDYSYMPTDELAAATERDPAPTFRRWLLDEGVLDEQALAEVDKEVIAEVEDAFAFAQDSPQPAASERYTDVFADEKVVSAL